MSAANNAILLDRARKAYADERYGAAQVQCEQILAGRSGDPDALQLLGRVYLAQHRYEDAARSLQRCATARPKRLNVQLLLGHALLQCGKYGPALDRFDKALKLDRDSREAIVGKAEVFWARAHHAKAVALLGPRVPAGTADARMALILARCLNALDRVDEALDTITRFIDEPGAGPGVRRQLLFLRGSLLERRGAYDDAFAAYTDANAVAPGVYEPDRYRERIDEIIEVFSAENLSRLPRAAHGLDAPVLIVGMPRCGSTLMERVLAAHPQVKGAGEASALGDIITDLPLSIGSADPYPRCVLGMSEAAMDEAGRAYVESLRGLVRGHAARIVDKSLINFEHVGFVSRAVPEAKVIDCRRDPVDTCFSCYASALTTAGHGYASSLTSVGHRYNQYVRLRDHWREVIDDGQLLTLTYEEMTADLEASARRLLDFLGLPWDERCLRFHETKAESRTISIDQVRKPLYRTSVARSERFAAHLGALREILDAGGAS